MMATEVAHSQVHIDEKIVFAERELHNLRTRRNALSLVNRLPPEVLATIFIHSASDYHYAKNRLHLITTVPRWVNVSYVCNHWRAVALNCPALWSYVFLTSPRWTEELLARSKQASLKLHVREASASESAHELYLLESVLDHGERIQELCLALSGEHLHRILSKFPRVPRLQDLKISSLSGPNMRTRSFTCVPFHGDTPTLRTLELTQFPLPWHSLTLGGLTELSLQGICGFEPLEDIAKMLNTLSRMENLTCLYLENALASAASFLSSTAFRTFKTITLGLLSRLSIRAPVSTVFAFLSCTNIPPTTQVRVSCVPERHSSYDDYAKLIPLLSQRFDAFQGHRLSSKIHSVNVSCALQETAELTFSADRWRPSRNVPLHISLYFARSMVWSDDGDCLVSNICHTVHLDDVRSIHVTRPTSSLTFWQHAFGHLRKLRHIRLSQGSLPRSLVSMLRVHHPAQDRQGVLNQDARADGSPAETFAPALEALELDNITLSADMMRPLLDALSTRLDSHGLLTMTDCYLCTEYQTSRWDKMVCTWEGGRIRVAYPYEGDVKFRPSDISDSVLLI